MKGTYYRWTRDATNRAVLVADILGAETDLAADQADGTVELTCPSRPLSPDEARMIGVRLIEAAALASGADAIRER